MGGMEKIGVIGGGNMGSALVRGIIAKGLIKPGNMVVAEKIPDKAQKLAEELGVRTAPWPLELDPVDVLLVAVKPQDIKEAIEAAVPAMAKDTLVISIAAGITLGALQAMLPKGQPLIRVMPNTPCLIGQGASALAPGENAGRENMDAALTLFKAVGTACEVPEKYMDAVTGLSGGGPAYVYLIIEALSDAGVRQGMDRPTALALAAQTVRGAASMILEDGRHPAELKDMVTSPGGTTIAGLHVMESAGLRGVLMDAVAAATARSRELGS